MGDNLLDKLSARLNAAKGAQSGHEEVTFTELSELDLEKISAAHENHHTSVHYNSP